MAWQCHPSLIDAHMHILPNQNRVVPVLDFTHMQCRERSKHTCIQKVNPMLQESCTQGGRGQNIADLSPYYEYESI